jgi:hypothetical protein
MLQKSFSLYLSVFLIILGMALAIIWNEIFTPIFLPFVSGVFQSSDGQIMVTDVAASLKLSLLTRSCGAIIVVCGVLLLVIQSRRRRAEQGAAANP